MKQRKVCIVVASRANYGRIKTVMQAVKDHPGLELQLIVGASALLYRYGKVIDIIERDGFTPDAQVYFVLEGENPTTMAKSTGLAIIELATIFERLEPDIVLTVADRFETIATAIAGSYMNIPVAHTQGGEITGSIDESVRHAITKLAHLHFPATRKAGERLIRMGENPDTVHVTGCPALDLINGADLSLTGIDERYGGVGAPVDWEKPYLLVMQHPVTTEYRESLRQINQTIAAVHKTQLQAVWLWPNVDAGSDAISKGLRMYREDQTPKNVHFYRNFAVEDFLRILANSACAVGNSSSFIREGSLLGVPSVNIGTRQEGRERGKNVIDVDYDRDDIYAAIMLQLLNGEYPKNPLYGDGNAGEKIAGILVTADFKLQKKLFY
jgi:UDP-hydrolysing UDP-N-acetyl-D-glucosamine 2-epimerase